jgi:hypothetical protein
MTKLKRRPSPALVISLIALFVALGSGAYAASKIGTKDIKKQAVTGSKLAKDAVKSNKTKDGGLKGKDLKDETVGLQQLDSASVGDGFQPRSDLIYASVSGGSLAADNSRGATSATSTGTGQYTVTFDRDVSDCAWFPSRSAIGTAIPANGDFLGVGGDAANPNNVRVRVRDQNNNFANRSFSLLVVC